MDGIEQIALQRDERQPFWVPLTAGAVAGTFCDITLFPLDTVKTRLQGNASLSSLSVRGLYLGLGPAALASAPSAALFFGTYDFAKTIFPSTPFGHGQAAACGEVVTCLFKVPFEVLKQRMQVGSMVGGSWGMLKQIYAKEGIRGCYAGLGATLAREIPFGFIQMPIYELLKRSVLGRENSGKSLSTWEACACGAVAGGVAAIATGPIDVWKTRLMLGNANSTIFQIAKSEGVRALFSGIVPRVLWISLGGSLFFGAYERVRGLLIDQRLA